ncbi:MAG: hypothetical protein Hyperionvirus9_14 [Hyperionvirus sp.]|uniref:Uncharacterized protein n=1 Tax=Hyperionvirus sp. TaxID=2487770 RepID=A0A3G5A8K7_9VIRU|nr:MAG: hypothetical protein Hyperionvirus9_14 [Hyperionvirus sp.]
MGNAQNSDTVYQEEQSFWNRTSLGIVNWLWALIILIIIICWAYKGKWLSGSGADWGSKKTGTVYFSDRGLMKAPTISPVEARLGNLME